MTARGVLSGLLLLLALSAPAGAAEVANGDFEAGPAEGPPPGWMLFDGGSKPLPPGAAEARVVPGAGVEGSRALCLTPAAGAFVNAGQQVGGIAPGERVLVECRVRAEGLEGYAGLWLMGMGSGEYVEADRSAVKGDTDWLRLHAEFVAGEGFSGLRIKLGVKGPGKVFIDDVRLLVGAEAERAAAGVAPTPSSTDWGLYRVEGRYRAEVQKPGAEHEIVFPIPVAIEGQAPLGFEVVTEPDGIISGVALDHRDGPNWIARCTLRPDPELEAFEIRTDALVLATRRDYSALDPALPLADYRKRGAVPEEAGRWLAASKTVQYRDGRVTALARKAKRGAKSLGALVAGIVREVREVYDGYPGPEFATGWDAVTTIKERTGCCGNANLVAALFRACGVPARILAGHPPRSGPHATHYVVEYYVPRFGWVLFESTGLGDRAHPSGQIEVSRVTPDDEDAGVLRVGIGQPAFWPGTPLFSVPELIGARDPASAGLRVTGAIPGAPPQAPPCPHRAVLHRRFAPGASAALQTELVELVTVRWATLLGTGDAGALAAPESFAEATSAAELRTALRAATTGK